MHRSSSSQSCRFKIRAPEHCNVFEEKKSRLLSRNQNRNVRCTSYNNDKLSRQKQTLTPFQQTAVTFRKGQGFSHRIRSSHYLGAISQWNVDQDSYIMRKNTSSQNKRRKEVNPLHLLNGEKADENKTKIYAESPYNSVSLRKKFLRKGTAINRAIMFNVLKSKCNQIITDSPSSYTNYTPNEPLVEAIKHQVPKGLRDSIGSEEMLRMSNIFTGGTIKSINLHHRVNEYIEKHSEKRLDKAKAEEDEQLTLKSIKRW